MSSHLFTEKCSVIICTYCQSLAYGTSISYKPVRSGAAVLVHDIMRSLDIELSRNMICGN